MKPRNREINIFSMSALDLFASALGAFILLTVVALPFFPNTGSDPESISKLKKQLKKAKAEANKTKKALSKCQTESQKTKKALKTCNTELKKKFLLVVISWKKEWDDVDLHIKDPRGNEYFYRKRRFSGSRAALEEDSKRGPGNEIWLHPAAPPGNYQIYYNYYKRKRPGNVTVRGSVLVPEGKRKLRARTLTIEKRKVLVATVTVGNDGNITIQEQ